MVRLATVRGSFHARVIAARLGAEGIVTELRGNVDGIYPIGEAHVFVGEDDATAARELLLADEVESAFETSAGDEDEADGPALWPGWVVLAAVVVAVALAFARS
jgi:hypothetical protein